MVRHAQHTETRMTNATEITPADEGLIAAILDEAMGLGLSDDGTVEWAASRIADAVETDADTAWSLAYHAFRRRGGKRG